MRLGCTCDRGSELWGRAYDKAVHCPACWTFWHDREHNLIRGGDGKVFEVVRELIQFPELACGHRGKPTGEIDSCHTCSGRVPVPLLKCEKLDKTCYTGRYTVTGSRSCDRCLDREANLSSDPPCGVVIGSYRWPRVVEANIRLIQRTCGNVPILVSDDCSKERELVRSICLAHGVDFVSTPEWRGHVGGDAAAFGHGLDWGKDRGLKVVAKLSMRMWMLGHRWLQRGSKELLSSSLPLASQCGNFGAHKDFAVRSEAALLNVERMRSGPFYNAPFHPLNGEEVLFSAMPGTEFHPWKELPTNRLLRNSTTMCHWTHDEAEYREVARKLGVILEPDFHVSGWEKEEARGEYKWG